MKELLKSCAAQAGAWVELRYHHRRRNSIVARNGRIETAESIVKSGVGVRTWVDGCYGFASTDEPTEKAIKRAVAEAVENARQLAKLKHKKSPELPPVNLAKEDYSDPGYEALLNMSLQNKMDAVIGLEKNGRNASPYITRATSRYSELLEDKIIVTSDGACARQRLAKPECGLGLIASRNGDQSTYHKGAGVSGDWEMLFAHPALEGVVENTSRLAVDLLSAGHVEGGRQTVILSPPIAGLLSHEAIGHTVEADYVQAGSVAKGKIGERVGSDLVTMIDTGWARFGGHPAGAMIFDDEGVPCRDVTIIENGILKSYLHNRESAVIFGVEPTGNARAWEYDNEPLIRMRNTCIAPGVQSLAEIIADTKVGFLLEGSNSGQADSTGEFMFGVSHAVEIRNGKLGKLFKEVTISGVAFEVLKTVDAVSSEFRWDLGTGYCGKGQAAKVDAGGPYLRCQLTLGGK
jgi:TldD protein